MFLCWKRDEPYLEGKGLPLMLRQTPVRICELAKFRRDSVCALSAEAVYCMWITHPLRLSILHQMKSSRFCIPPHNSAIGAQHFQSLFTLSAVMSEQGPVMQGRRIYPVCSLWWRLSLRLPSVEEDGLPIPL